MKERARKPWLLRSLVRSSVIVSSRKIDQPSRRRRRRRRDDDRYAIKVLADAFK